MADSEGGKRVVHHEPGKIRPMAVRVVTIATVIATLSGAVLAEAPKTDSTHRAQTPLADSFKKPGTVQRPIVMEYSRSTANDPFSIRVAVSNNARLANAFAYVDTYVDGLVISTGLANELGITGFSGPVTLNVGGMEVSSIAQVSSRARTDVHFNPRIMGASNVVIDMGNERITFNQPDITLQWQVPFSMLDGIILFDCELKIGGQSLKGKAMLDTGNINTCLTISPATLRRINPDMIRLHRGETMDDIKTELGQKGFVLVSLTESPSLHYGGRRFREDSEFPGIDVRYLPGGAIALLPVGWAENRLLCIVYTSDTTGYFGVAAEKTIGAAPQQ